MVTYTGYLLGWCFRCLRLALMINDWITCQSATHTCWVNFSHAHNSVWIRANQTMRSSDLFPIEKCHQLVKVWFPFSFPYWSPVFCSLFATILDGPCWQNTRMQILGTSTSAWELCPLVYAVNDQTGAFHDVCWRLQTWNLCNPPTHCLNKWIYYVLVSLRWGL